MTVLTTIRGRWVALAMILVIVAAACSDGDSATSFSQGAGDEPAADEPASEEPRADTDSGGVSVEGEPPADQPAADEPASDDSAADQSGGLAVPVALTPADIGRDIIYRAAIAVQVDDVAAAGREAQAIIEGLGGIVFGQETVTEPEARTVLTFKVFPADFSDALDRLAGLGDLVTQQVTADDVTERVVDLESRIGTAATSVERLRNLLDEAGDVAVIAQLEDQLLQRETTLEQLRGQLRTIQDQVDLATITLTITPSPRVLPRSGVGVAAWLSEGGDDPCLGVSDLVVRPDATVHLCIEIENLGETTLTDIDLDSGELRLDLDEMTVVEGEIDQLAVGERLVVTTSETLNEGRIAGRVATRGVQLSAIVTATPVDERGDRLAQVSEATSVVLIAEQDDSLPGFGDALGGSVDALQYIGGIIVILAGAVLPFLPLVGIVALTAFWTRRRRAGRVDPGDDEVS